MLTNLKNQLEKQRLLKIDIHVVPKSKKNQLVDSQVNSEGKIALKLKIQGAPEKNKVNLELIDYLSDLLEIPKSHISIIAGQTSRHKIIQILK